MLAGGTGDQNLSPKSTYVEDKDFMLSRIRSMLVFSVENRGPKIDTRSGMKKADVMIERWKNIFSKYDSEGSGVLCRSDIRRLVRVDLKIPARIVTDEDIVTLFVALDLDEGGSVDFTEFLEFVQQPSSRGAVTEQDIVNSVARAVRITLMKNRIKINELESTFRSFDESGDVSTGELGPNDMIRFFRKVLKVTKHDVSDKNLRTAFYAMDDDGSGKMSMEELTEFIRFCSMEQQQRQLPARVPGLLGGMRGEPGTSFGGLPKRVPSRRPGTFSTLSHVPFCLNGRDIEGGGRLLTSTQTPLVRSLSDPGMRTMDTRERAKKLSHDLSTTQSLRELDVDARGDEEPRAMSSGGVSPTSAGGHDRLDKPATSPSRKKKVWSGKLPGDSNNGYVLLKGAEALNQVENRLFEAGIDVRGRYHTLGRVRVQAWN